MWANVYNRHEGREAAVLYCAPSKIVLQGEQLIDILRREVEARPELAHRPRCSFPRAPPAQWSAGGSVCAGQSGGVRD